MSDYAWPDNQTTAVPPKHGLATLYRIARISLVVLTVFLAALLFAVLIFLPATELREIEIRGASYLSDSEILAWSNLPVQANWFSLNSASLQVSLLRNPGLEAVSVSRRFPATLAIDVVERQALAVVYARDRQGRLKAHCVDVHGVVFAALDARTNQDVLPVLSGLEIRGLQYGMNLGPRFASLLASLDELRASQPALLQSVSELRIVDLKEAGFELLLYPVHYPVPVRLKPVLSADILKSILLVLDVVDGRGLIPTIQELDFRTDTYVYRIKEAVSG